MKRGLYFLANDAVIDLAIAFLNSVRQHNPDLPICFIPFDDRCARLLETAPPYGATVFGDARLLRECDEIGREIHGSVVGHYRKLAIWHGDYDEFVYIDVDTVVLKPVEFVFTFLANFDFITSHSHLDGIRKWVWKESIVNAGLLAPEQIAYAANTGFIVSRRGALMYEIAFEKLPAVKELRGHMVLECQEQSFLNYLIVTSGLRYSSLRTIARAYAAAGIEPRIPLEHWAGNPNARIEGGAAWSRSLGSECLLIHWAGEWRARRTESWLERRRRAAPGVDENRTAVRVRRRMPFKDIWCHYRTLRAVS